MNPANSDPVIDEIREIRHRISERCGPDPRRLYEYYRQVQERYQDRLVGAQKSERTASSS